MKYIDDVNILKKLLFGNVFDKANESGGERLSFQWGTIMVKGK